MTRRRDPAFITALLAAAPGLFAGCTLFVGSECAGDDECAAGSTCATDGACRPSPPGDAGIERADAGAVAPTTDAGAVPPTTDAGSPAADAGRADAGAPEPDGGSCVDTDVLFDDFEDGASGPPWSSEYADPPSTIAEAEGRLTIELALDALGFVYASRSLVEQDLYVRRWTIELLEVPTTDAPAETYLAFANGADPDDFLQVSVDDGFVELYEEPSEELQTEPYDPVDDRFLRLVEGAGTLTAQSSPDGVVWRAYATTATPSWWGDVDVEIGAGTYGAHAAPGRAAFGAVWSGPAVGRDCP